MLVYCCKRLKLGMLELRHFCSNSAPHAGVVNANRISPQHWVPAFFLLAGRLRASCSEGYIAKIVVLPHPNWLAGVVVVSLYFINTLQTRTNLFEKIASPLHYMFYGEGRGFDPHADHLLLVMGLVRLRYHIFCPVS
jgi:hypothetical protein